MRSRLGIAATVIAVAFALAVPASGSAGKLTHERAETLIRKKHGHVKACTRLSPRRFRCTARFWFWHILDEKAGSGKWKQVLKEPFYEDLKVDVWRKGIKVWGEGNDNGWDLEVS